MPDLDPAAAAVQHAQALASDLDEDLLLLRWDLPGGEADQLRWMLHTGSRFSAADPLAVVRLPDGALWELRSGRAGTLIRTHVPDGARIASGDWLATVELDVRPFR